MKLKASIVLTWTEITPNNRLSLQSAELESPNYWGRPINFYRFLKTNLKYVLQNRV